MPVSVFNATHDGRQQYTDQRLGPKENYSQVAGEIHGVRNRLTKQNEE
jgi:hypothetical protein